MCKRKNIYFCVKLQMHKQSTEMSFYPLESPHFISNNAYRDIITPNRNI